LFFFTWLKLTKEIEINCNIYNLRRHVRNVSGIKVEVLLNYNIQHLRFALLFLSKHIIVCLLICAYAFYVLCIRKYKGKEQIKLLK